MESKVVRIWRQDVERLNNLSGLPRHVPVATKLHAILNRVEGDAHLRKVISEELLRAAGAR